MIDEKPCRYCGGIDREATKEERALGNVMEQRPDLTLNEIAILAKRFGVKARLIITKRQPGDET